MDNERDTLWDYLLDNGLASEEALQLITNINGFSLETLESVLYSTTGYHTLAQYLDEEEEE